MRILITGGFGFLGGRLAQWLTSQGSEVILGSRRDASSPAWLPQARVVRTPWDSDADLERACEGVGAVVHLAGMNAQDSTANPEAARAFNGDATARLVKATQRQRVARFIYFSTAHVYASPLAGTITERMRPVGPHPYATSHLAGEQAVLQRHAGTTGVVVRLSNAYGPPAHRDANCWTLLVNDLCREAATKGTLTLRSTGSQRRDFIPITDVCRAAAHLLALPAAQLGDGVFNVGGEWSPTVLEMATLIQERSTTVFGRRPELTRQSPAPVESDVPLEYRIDALRGSGFANTSDRVAEVDRLLEFCAKSFS